MHEETIGSKVVKWILIGISILFLVLMLLLPLITVISEALRDGWKTYQAAVTDKYTVSNSFNIRSNRLCCCCQYNFWCICGTRSYKVSFPRKKGANHFD